MQQIAGPDDSPAAGRERTLYAFLAETERRSGSRRTVQSYARMLRNFFGRSGRTPDEVTSQDVFTWAYGTGLSGRVPGSVTIGARLACVSSFCRFLIRMKVVASNPCDALDRPRVAQSTPRGLSADQRRGLLDVISSTPAGSRDRAIILTLVLTGRRRAEVMGLKVRDISNEGSAFNSYRGNGGKVGKRELLRPARDAIETWLASLGRGLATMDPDDSLWPDTRTGRGITSGTFYTNLRRYLKQAGLPPAGVHVFRHSAAKLRRDAGESVEEVSRFLDHSSLGVTTTYLRRLEGQEDKSWAAVAEAIGL
jgi:site-specific recombinase XerD